MVASLGGAAQDLDQLVCFLCKANSWEPMSVLVILVRRLG